MSEPEPEREPAFKVRLPEPGDLRYKGTKVRVMGNLIWVELGPEWVHKEPRPGRPIPEEDRWRCGPPPPPVPPAES